MQTLQFTPYNTQQLKEILQQRVKQEFQPGSVREDVVEEIAEKVPENSGDARMALEILLKLGRVAVRQRKSQVSLSEVDRYRSTSLS